MKTLILLICFVASQSAMASNLEWKLAEAQVVQSQDAMVRQAGLKTLVLTFTAASCSPLDFQAATVELTSFSEFADIDVTPESRQAAATRAGVVFEICDNSHLQTSVVVRDGAYNIKVNGIQKSAVIVQGQIAQVN